MPIKMLVFDVDGTLYDLKSHAIPKSCIEGIKKAKEHGYLFVIASGRAHYGLGKAIDALHADYILSANGGVVVDQTKKIISHQDIAYDDCLKLISFAKEQEAGLVFKFPHHMYIYQHPEKVDWLAGQMESDIGKEVFIFHSKQDHHEVELPQCASLHADPKEVMRFAKHSNLSFHQFSDDGFDVAPKGVHKGAGLKQLMDYLHVKKEEVACFGDNYNDLEMFDTAGYRIAMGNAVDEVKAKADFITASSDQDGIYLGLRHLHCIDE